MATSSKFNSKTVKDNALNGFGHLVGLLPTGTVFLYQYLNPLLTNTGKCTTENKYLSGMLIGLCGLACFFSTFTDSYIDNDGITHYGIATFKGFYQSSRSSSNSSVDFKSYRLKPEDFVHAFFTLAVFGVVSLLDTNTVNCLYPSFESTQKTLLMALPPVLGAVSGTVFVIFPKSRHGIGYPSTRQGSASSAESPKV